jgi:glycosyltransferase involved in cell wall biosynthesis
MVETKPTLLFIDAVCPRPYDPSNINVPGGVGGTEQTMVDLAEGLAETGLFNVVVEQHNRLEGEEYAGKAKYASYGSTPKAKWVVVLRDPRPMVKARERFRDSKIYLYSHDLADRNLGLCLEAGFFSHSGCIANICVSQWHRSQTIETLKPFGYSGQFRVRTIYNPLSHDVVRTGESYDPNKLVWLASPHKGLARAYEIFKCLVRINPDFRLYVTNPGYMESQYTDDKEIKDRTIVLGTIPHSEAISHLSNALCLFYPNTVFPETFGKIMAEANAVGTPVITSPLGAAKEVLDSHPEQVMDCRDTEGVVKRIMKWYGGARPIVRGNPKFKLSNVVQEWVRLLNDIR